MDVIRVDYMLGVASTPNLPNREGLPHQTAPSAEKFHQKTKNLGGIDFPLIESHEGEADAPHAWYIGSAQGCSGARIKPGAING